MLRNVLADLLLIGLSLAFLLYFAFIWRYSQLLVQEPNIIIRSLETAMFLIIFAFGVARIVADLRK